MISPEQRRKLAEKFFIKELGLSSILCPIKYVDGALVNMTNMGEFYHVMKNGKSVPGAIRVRIDDKISIDQQIETLAHELVHLKQLVSGDVDFTNRLWHGKDYSDTNNLTAPWEIDARQKSRKLMIDFNRFMLQKFSKVNKIKVK